jgi:excisionase family DNA binding protein
VDSFDYILASPAQRRITDAIEAATAATIEAIQTAQQAAAPASPAIPTAQTYLSLSDAAKALGLSVKSVRRLIKSGRLSAVDSGTGKRKHYRIAADALAAIQNPAAAVEPIKLPRQRRATAQPARSSPGDIRPRIIA